MSSKRRTVFKVLDAMDGPHGGRILRLRLQSGDTPSVNELRGARMEARGPEGGDGLTFEIDGFAVFGGQLSDDRFARTGRIDVHVADDSAEDVGATWLVSGPV